MTDFNAEKAKEIVHNSTIGQLHNVLIDIRTAAENGETVLHIYKALPIKVLDELRLRGFRVQVHTSIDTQKDKLFYSIYWN